MTFIIGPGGVRNTEGTEVRMGKARIRIGGDFQNEGKTKIYETDLDIVGNLIQKGELTVNDPHKFTEAVIKLAVAGKDFAEFGKKVIDLLQGKRLI